MRLNSIVNTRIGKYVAALSILVMIFILTLRINDDYYLILLFSAISLTCVGMISLARLTSIDIAFCLVSLYELVSLLWADCPLASMHNVCACVCMFNIYFSVRRISYIGETRCFIFNGSLIIIAIVFILALWSFYIFQKASIDAGFSEIYSLRFLFRPLGYITNVWAELLLVLLGWIGLARRYFILFTFGCVLLILLSFSRGAYISLATYLIVSLVIFQQKIIKIKLLIVIISAAMVVVFLYPTEISTTLCMNRTNSQQLSTKGRINASYAAWNAFKSKPIMGYGNNNFTYAVDNEIYQDSRQTITTIPPNIISQMLVEKGCIGIFFYLLLFFSVFKYAWKYRHDNDIRIFIAVFIAVLSKEMSLATIFSEPVIMMMMYIMLALIQNKGKLKTVYGEKNYIILSLSLICFIVWNCPFITRLIDPTATLVNVSLKKIKEYKQSGNTSHLVTAEKVLRKALIRHTKDEQIRFLLSEVFLLKGDKDKSSEILDNLVRKYPHNSLYWLKLSDIQYENNEKAAALNSFVMSVRYYPRVLQNRRTSIWENSDTLFYKSLKERLRTIRPSIDDSPSEYARCGYIAYWCGNNKAMEYLRVSISSLPNLVIPWYFLGDEQKYNLLKYGAFRKKGSRRIIDDDKITDEQIFIHLYAPKFQTWYNGILFRVH